jgi:D-alanyl-D-alanine carboxypeptidase/D-alanyl-D-alanine-endopeptidase (penicillin-binding protein 4)
MIFKLNSIIKVIIIITLLFDAGNNYSQKIPQSKIDELASKLDSICIPLKSAGVKVSCKVMHADFNKVLYEFEPGLQMIPASITKLIIGAAAFSKLGATYEFTTKIFTDDNNINDGAINGNLYIKGYGDPDFNSGDVVQLAMDIQKKGIKEITGNIVADESYFDNNYYTLSGYFQGDTGPSYWPYISGLCLDKTYGAMSAGNTLSNALNKLGISVNGIVIVGTTPPQAKQITQTGHKIYDVLSYMLKESDNHSAIMVFKHLGAKLKNTPATLEDGQAAIIQFLNELGIDRYSYEILEGSGLTRYNKVNADMYMRILKYMYDDIFLFDYFLSSLAIAGKDGTLRKRMIGTSAEGNVYAKTGTLKSVSALSGYVINKDNEIIMFYTVMNGFPGDATDMRAAQDDICILLSEFSRY